jgi:dTDP-4-amino-4,6-dideoxygalactose transaminase
VESIKVLRKTENLIPINLPIIGKEEIEAVTNVLKTGPLTNALGLGPKVTAFERDFAKFANVSYAVAVNTGTAALHLAVMSTGLKPGDEVILPSFTFVATAEAVIMAGGIPVFVDIDPKTFNINPEKIKEKITEKTRIILPVDLFGFPADLKPIREIALPRDIFVIEDAAQAHGGKYFGKSVGFLSDATCWSFYASKNMTTGEGGIITSNNCALVDSIKLLRTHGEKIKYSSVTLGYNYRMTELQAAIGLEQLKKLPTFINKRTRNAKKLKELLLKENRLELPSDSEDLISGWNLFTVKIKNSTEKERNRIVERLRKNGIGAAVYYVNPVHLMPYYKQKFGAYVLPETEKAAKTVFSLPIHPGLKESQIEFIAQTLINIL